MALRIKLFSEKTQGLGAVELPEGKYVFQVDDVDTSTAKTGRNQLSLRLSVCDGGPFHGTKIWERLNLPVEADSENSFIRRLWKDIVAARPECYDGELLHEDRLKGLCFTATVVYEADADGVERRKLRGYLFHREGNVGTGTPGSEGPVPAQKQVEAKSASGWDKARAFNSPGATASRR